MAEPAPSLAATVAEVAAAAPSAVERVPAAQVETQPLPVAQEEVAAAPPPKPESALMGLATEIIGKATIKRCTDIHLEPEAKAVMLRYLLSGEILADCALPKEIHPELVRAYKSIAQLNDAVTDMPQDRKFKKNVSGEELELRVTTLPSEHGEMVAISIRYEQQ